MLFQGRAPVFRQRGESGAKDGIPDIQSGSTLVLFFVPDCMSGVQSEAEANGTAFKDRRPAFDWQL